MKISLCGGDYEGRSSDAAYIMSLNLYPEKVETEDGTADKVLIGTPGDWNVSAWDYSTLIAQGQCRGTHTSSWGTSYAIYDNQLLQIDDDVSIGTIIGIVGASLETTPIIFADNGKELCMVDGIGLYIHTKGTSLVDRIDIPNVLPTHVVYNFGYFIVNNTFLDPAISYPPTNTILYYSGLYDGRKWDTSLYFFTAEGSADPVTSIKCVSDQIWAQGTQRYELFYPTGLNVDDLVSPGNPFARLGTSLTQTGLYAPYSTVTTGAELFWVGIPATGGITVFKNNGIGYSRISTHAQEYQLGKGDCSDIIATAYSAEGHDFVIFSSDNLNLTLVWDDTQMTWHRRSSHNYIGPNEDRWRCRYAFARGQHTYMGSANSNQIFKLDLDKYDEHDGNVILRKHTTPIVNDELQGISHLKVSLQVATGNGSSDPGDLGYRPVMSMAQSDDAGHSWNQGPDQYMGMTTGDYGRRITWWNRGYARLRQYQFWTSAKVKQVWVACYVDLQSTKR